MSEPQIITTLGEFLAHALELEQESVERYRELADSMEVHNNLEVAELFKRLAEYSRLHAQEVRERTRGLDIPAMAPWEFKWNCPESPEAPCMEEVHYLMTPHQALQLALHNEARGRDFYARVAKESADPEVRRAAAELAEEEHGHVKLLEEWIGRAALQTEPPPEDLDPPNMPE
jgi:rubrerythrin